MWVVAHRQAEQAGAELEARAPMGEYARPGRVLLVTAAGGLHVRQPGLGGELFGPFEVARDQKGAPLREQPKSGLFVEVQGRSERARMGNSQPNSGFVVRLPQHHFRRETVNRQAVLRV